MGTRKIQASFAWMLVILVVGWLVAEDYAHAQSTRVLPDLAFNFVCKQAPLDEAVERFLTDQGFTVLNQVRADKERGLRANFPQLVFGLDKRRSIIKFVAVPPFQGKYDISLITQPPTQRESALEEALLQFVSDQLRCEIRQLLRHENGPASAEAYENHLKTIEGFFRDAAARLR